VAACTACTVLVLRCTVLYCVARAALQVPYDMRDVLAEVVDDRWALLPLRRTASCFTIKDVQCSLIKESEPHPGANMRLISSAAWQPGSLAAWHRWIAVVDTMASYRGRTTLIAHFSVWQTGSISCSTVLRQASATVPLSNALHGVDPPCMLPAQVCV
jgi:hypothetical protein